MSRLRPAKSRRTIPRRQTGPLAGGALEGYSSLGGENSIVTFRSSQMLGQELRRSDTSAMNKAWFLVHMID
jgi:hypothetical protein